MKLSKTQLIANTTWLSLAAVTLVSCRVSNKVEDASTDEFARNQYQGRSLPPKTLSLTFDDGPGERTLELGAYLKSEGIAATFFVVGKGLRGKEHILQGLKNQGHLIANHSFAHPSMPGTLDPVAEVTKTDEIIAPYVDQNRFLFRAPFGAWNATLPSKLNNTAMKKYVGPIFWDVGGQMSTQTAADWACWSQGISLDDCSQRYLTEIRQKGRGIVLMHDPNGRFEGGRFRYLTVEMTMKIVPILKAEGYQFVRVDEVPAIKAAFDQTGSSPSQPDPSVPTDTYYKLSEIQAAQSIKVTVPGLNCRRTPDVASNNILGAFTQGHTTILLKNVPAFYQLDGQGRPWVLVQGTNSLSCFISARRSFFTLSTAN